MKNVPRDFEDLIKGEGYGFKEFVIWNKEKKFGNPETDKVIQIMDSYNKEGKRFYEGMIYNFPKTSGVDILPIEGISVEDIPEEELMSREKYSGIVKLIS